MYCHDVPPLISRAKKTRGLKLDKRQYKVVLEGLVGRVRDVDDAVVDAAVEALRSLHRAAPARWEARIAVARILARDLHTETA